MSTQNIVIGIIVLIAVGGGIYWYMTHPSGSMSAQTDQSQQAQSGTGTTTDQVQGQDVTVGTGKEATPGSTVTLEYVGRLEDGTTFDSSASHNQPLVFQLGAAGIIPGFQIGVNGMKVGGERVILIPPTLGYGEQDVKDNAGKVIIPGNSKLIFNIKLTKVEAGTTTPPTGGKAQ